MSKSLKRVRACLIDAGITPDIREMAMVRTAADAATALDCDVNQIAKSIVLRGETTGAAVLFITAGGNQVDLNTASILAGEPLGKADSTLIRAQTGFAIGSVSPIGHLTQPCAWFDRKLLDFDLIWAVAGTPHHLFGLPLTLIIETSKPQASDFTI